MSMSDEKHIVLKALRSNNGSTVAELSRSLSDIPRYRIHPAIVELQTQKLVKEGLARNCNELRMKCATWWAQS